MRSLNIPFEGVNILADERLRSGMKEYSQWPTFPQVYVGGEFVGGADILIREWPLTTHDCSHSPCVLPLCCRRVNLAFCTLITM